MVCTSNQAESRQEPQLFLQRLLTGEDPGLHPDRVVDLPVELLVDGNQEVDDIQTLETFSFFDPFQKQRTIFDDFEIGRQLLDVLVFILKGKLAGIFLYEKIKRIDDRHFSDYLHGHLEFLHLVVHHHTGQVVAERILLPVDEMFFGFNIQRIGVNLCPAVRSGFQPDYMGAHVDQVTILVGGIVPDRYDNCHIALLRIVTKKRIIQHVHAGKLSRIGQLSEQSDNHLTILTIIVRIGYE